MIKFNQDKEDNEMKLLMRLAILVAALLLVCNMAFAVSCDREVCYDVTLTSEYGSTNNDHWWVCLNDSGTGYLYSTVNHYTFYLYLFKQPAFYSTEQPGWGWGSWILQDSYGYSVAHVWTQGLGLFLQGAGVEYGTRYTVQGKQVPCELNGNFNGND
jgi:hypothetical protein